MDSAVSHGKTFFNDLKQYVGFTDESTTALRDLLPLAATHFPTIVDDCYRAIDRYPDTRKVLTGGATQVAHLKRTLTEWLETLLSGPHDQVYFESRARMGHAQVRSDLPQGQVCMAMSRIRITLSAVVDRHDIQPLARQQRMWAALQQILDLDLAIMLESYREDLLARNRDAERLATIGQLAAGIGHELRNPLAIMETSVYLLRQRLAPLLAVHPEVNKHLDRVGTEVKRATNTVSDLMGLAHSRSPRRERTAVRAVVEEAIEAALVPPRVMVEVALPADLTGDFDREQMRHVLANVLTNAAQAVGGGGRVKISGRERSDGLELRIEDDGPGVPEVIRRRIFEPLFTTKAQGSGIGLALCRRIMDAHGGTIELELEGQGATFVVRLPSPRRWS